MVARLAESEGLVPLHVTPQLRVALKVGDEYCPSERRSGPWGPLRDRCYDFFAPTSAPPEVIVADQILGVPLPEPWVEFHQTGRRPALPGFGPDLPFQFRAEVCRTPTAGGVHASGSAGRRPRRSGCRSLGGAAGSDLKGTSILPGPGLGHLPGGGGNLYGLQSPAPTHGPGPPGGGTVDLLLTRPLEIP